MNQCEQAFNEDCRSTEPRASVEEIELLYDRNRFIDAFALCREKYDNLDRLADEDVRKVILLGRLAGRLGSRQLLKDIFQIARTLAPEDPLVCYFAGRQANSFEHPLRHIEEVESFPGDKFTSARDRASWLASSAVAYAMVRDFEKAHDFLSSAVELNSERAWIRCCEAEVLCCEDRWAEALTAAECAWRLCPGMPQAAAILGRILAKSGKIAEAAEQILGVAQQGQSYETFLTGIWYLCADAEKSSGEVRNRLARQALTLADRLESLAPLGDADFRSQLALTRIDIAWLLQDRELMRAQAENVQHPFYQTILENIDRNASSNILISAYQPVFQKHNACLPTSVAAVLGRFGHHIDADALADELTFQGTAIWRVVDWLTRQDMIVKPFIADADLTKQLLKSDLPFVFMTRSVHHYHAMAAVGLDEAADVLLLHDPGNVRMDKMLLSEIGRGEAPFGPEALAIVPRDEADLLAMIPDAASLPFTAFLQYQKTRDTIGHMEGRSIIENLKSNFSDHPFTERMEAIHQGFMGAPGEAIKQQVALLRHYPDCEYIRQELLTNLHRTGNRSLIRRELSRIVLNKKLPGIRAAQEWLYPPAEYVSQFATYAGMVKTGYDQAVELLWNAIEKEPVHAASYHVLGDVYRQEGRFEQSVLPYRCAATLEPENHHYARAYLDALSTVDRLQEGFVFLRRRIDRLGDTVAGGEVWVTLIEAYEDYGYPDPAIAAMEQALTNRGDDAYLLNYAVSFWGRMGKKEKEKESLEALQRTGHRPFFFAAATYHHHWSGNWREALEFCGQWINEEPDNVDARREMAQLWAKAEGKRAALELAEKWMSQKPGNDDFELLYYDNLNSLFEYDRQLDLLRARLNRNSYDTWAYRELAFTLIYVIDIGQNRDEVAIRAELAKIMGKYRVLCPDDAVLYAIHGELAVLKGNFSKAVGLYLEATRRDPEYGYAYQQAWRCAGKLAEDQRKALFEQLEKNMFRCTGFLRLAKDLANMAAEYFGSREAHRMVDEWQARCPRDPEIIKAKANLLLDYGQGKTDAEKALALLEDATTRFPNHADFMFILARAYRILQDEENWVATSRAILTRFPLRSIQRRQLAEYYRLKNEPRHAADLLAEGIRFEPLDGWLRYDLIALKFQNGEKPEALALARKSLDRIPEDINFRHRLVELLFDNGDEQMALEVARAGTEVYPEGAVLWRYYGDALWRSQLTADIQAVEEAYLKALQFNPRFLDAADRLAEFYTYQNRFEEARRTIDAQKPYHVEQADLLTRLAWIERRAGNASEAMDQLLAVVERWPRERWSWQLLLDWIRTDERWDLAKSVLKNAHSVMEEDPDFVSDKLDVLHQAGFADDATEAEWDRLLKDFPENEKVHCLRFDILHQKEQLEAAEKVLSAIEKYNPGSPYLLARRSALKADQQQFDQAVDAALRLMELPYDVGSWCRQKVWGAFRDYRQLPRLIEAALSEWEKDGEIEPSFFRMLVSDIDTIYPAPGRITRLLADIGIKPPVVRRLSNLLDQSVRRDNPAGAYTAAILEKLVDSGWRRILLRFAKQNPDFAAGRTAVWQIIGYTLVNGSKSENNRARHWLSAWPKHECCDLWAIANLIIAIEKSSRLRLRKKLELILENAREAVQTRPCDHTLQFVICKYCEAALRLGRDELFLDWVNQYRNVLEDNESGYWQQTGNLDLPWAILQFGILLEAEPHQIKQLSKSFRKAVTTKSVRDWVRPQWRTRARRLKKRKR